MDEEALTVMEFLKTGDFFLEGCVQELLAGGFPAKYEPDHLAYTCASAEEFAALRQLMTQPQMLDQQVDGRTVTTILLTLPFKARGYEVFVLELCDQIPEGLQRSGFHHLGIVPHKEMLGTEQFVGGISKRSKKDKYGFDVKRLSDPGEEGYDVLLEDGHRVRISDTSLMAVLLEEAELVASHA